MLTGRRWGPVRGAARSDDATALYLGLRCGKEIAGGGRWPTWAPVASSSAVGFRGESVWLWAMRTGTLSLAGGQPSELSLT